MWVEAGAFIREVVTSFNCACGFVEELLPGSLVWESVPVFTKDGKSGACVLCFFPLFLGCQKKRSAYREKNQRGKSQNPFHEQYSSFVT